MAKRSQADEARDGAMAARFASDLSHVAANMDMYARWIKDPHCADMIQLFEAARQVRRTAEGLRYGTLGTTSEAMAESGHSDPHPTPATEV